MKKKIILLIILTALGVNSFAQTAFDYLREALVNVLSVSTMIQVADYEYKSGGALWGTYLDPGESISLISDYDAGVEYLMLAASHAPDRDIDLKVYQGRSSGGRIVGQDTGMDAAPVVRFTPSSSGDYTFEIINSSNRPAFAALVVLKYKRNAKFSFITLAEALSNTLYMSEALVADLPFGTEIPSGKWALFGGDVQQGSSTGYYNSSSLGGLYMLVGAGEDSVKNCDVEVVEQYALNNQDGKKISRNTGTTLPFDYGIFEPNRSKYHNLKIYNKSSQKASSFMFGFLIQVSE